MPGKLKVKIIAGRNLPVMDRSSDTTDAFVEIKLGSTTYKTDVCRKSLNPQWNSDWYKFEMEDSELQDEPLQIRLMDYDTYSANDAIGKVYLNLNPLLLPSSLAVSHDPSSCSASSVKGISINGWLPVYDTMHGIRGEVSIVVKLELFEDFNKFRQSSCGIQFFSSNFIPEGYTLKTVHGFVEELVFADDPEYQWIDKIRTPRSTNEARQTLFFKLNGEVKRKIGLKVLDLGANAVVGYRQCFDLEGECGVVVRGLGTAVTLDVTSIPTSPDSSGKTLAPREKENGEKDPICRRSSDSDISVTPRGNSLSIEKGKLHITPQRPLDSFDMVGDYPFLTLTKYPPGFVQHVAGMVSARGVKLLGVDEAETRDSWWTELRLEVRSHARALSCNAVIAYTEHTTVCEDVCILSASGTAAVIDHKDYEVVPMLSPDANGCKVYHVPYNEISHPFKMKLAKCSQCKKGKVGEVLMTSAELMDGVKVIHKSGLIQAIVCRHKRECKGELNAKEVSDALPFLEYELHTQLMHKLSAAGANAIVGLRVELCLGERVLIGHATGTAVTLAALPAPTSPIDLEEAHSSDDDECEDLLKELELSSGNKDTCLLEISDNGAANNITIIGAPPDGYLVSTTQCEYSTFENLKKPNFYINFINRHRFSGIPGAIDQGLTPVRNLQMFTQLWKARMCPLPSSATISAQFNRLLQGVYFKLRGMTPCALVNLRFKIDIPQQDDLQISVVVGKNGTKILSWPGIEPAISSFQVRRLSRFTTNGILPFCPSILNSGLQNTFFLINFGQMAKKPEIFRLPHLNFTHHIFRTPPKEQRYGVDVTPLHYVAGGKIVSYLGNLNFFFIRESSCIRETGGLSAFSHGFVAEVLAIVRAHVTAIGGNALVSYTMSECHLTNNAHKNQAQCLLNVGGDAVFVSYSE
ncbi:unnamed protein product [Nesidiocoris tenuis]|uniref:C2 domain-containing protein n=1 Tax=Nesidiocoris tenuis TaxID=355587 RepID=A0A6H5GFM9_9HEMI|nr:unnamed protein product [Nesidiocoris tenuis]